MAHSPLDPASPFFHEERHESLLAIAGRPITIGGVGALGGVLAESLARMGFRNLTVIDRDRVEMRNLSTQPYSRAEIGAPKVRALANSLYRAVEARVTPLMTELTAANADRLLANSALIIDAFDNRPARAAVSAAANRLGIACLHIGFSPDGLYGSGLWEPGYLVPAERDHDPCDYPLTRPLAQMVAALAARSIVDFLHTGQRFDCELTWSDLRVSRQLREDSAPSAEPG